MWLALNSNRDKSVLKQAHLRALCVLTLLHQLSHLVVDALCCSLDGKNMFSTAPHLDFDTLTFGASFRVCWVIKGVWDLDHAESMIMTTSGKHYIVCESPWSVLAPKLISY